MERKILSLDTDADLTPLYTTRAQKEKDSMHPIIATSQYARKMAHKFVGVDSHMHSNAPIWHNPAIKINNRVIYWPEWARQEIQDISNMLTDDKVTPFTDLQHQFQLPHTAHWKYIQLCHALQKALPVSGHALPLSPIVKHLVKWKNCKGLISGLHGLLIDKKFSVDTSIELKRWWDLRLGSEYEEEEWDDILDSYNQGLREARLKFSFHKLIHRWHWTPKRLMQAKLSVHSNCWRCGTEDSDIVHILWECPKLSSFWKDIESQVQSVIPDMTKLSAKAVLLHDKSTMPKMSKTEFRWFSTAMGVAKLCILRLWKSDKSPKTVTWLEEMFEMAKFERLIYKLNDSLEQFHQVWNGFLR